MEGRGGPTRPSSQERGGKGPPGNKKWVVVSESPVAERRYTPGQKFNVDRGQIPKVNLTEHRQPNCVSNRQITQKEREGTSRQIEQDLFIDRPSLTEAGSDEDHKCNNQVVKQMR